MLLVVADAGLTVPQADPPEVVNVTVSPATGSVLLPVTVAVMASVVEPFAAAVGLAAETVTVLNAVWVTVVEPLNALSASVAVMVQVPAVVLVR